MPGRNLDIYAADLERIEVLEGPQGTLFGAGAEAGVLRYITNKPKLDVTEANVNAGYAITASGDPSTNVDATINLPVIADTLAVRAVVYNDSRGGYINNIPGTFAPAADGPGGRTNYFGGVVPPNTGPINNTANRPAQFQPRRRTRAFAQPRSSRSTTTGTRCSAQSYQNMDAEGVFFEEEYDARRQGRAGSVGPALQSRRTTRTSSRTPR